ncbi:MAG: solute carrier 26 family protein [Actinomycetia bacterium]|nr:solute carrier 26 family protein [Actinomycetes bacterium]
MATPTSTLDRLQGAVPAVGWGRTYDRADLRSDLGAGLTVGAMLVPQAMAYALLAGLPPEVGLYAATIPVLLYAVFGTSRQLAVGPVAIVSLLTASALAPLVDEGTAGYLTAAALLAFMVGVVHLTLGLGRLGFLVNFLSHSVLVGFTAAAALIIGFSQAKHLIGVKIPRGEFFETVNELARHLGEAHGLTLAVGLGSVAVLLGLKRWAQRVPGALIVVIAATMASALFDFEGRGVKVVGDIPDSLPAFGFPEFDGSLIGSLATTAVIITIVGFMESIAVAKVYARRHRYDVVANQELIGLGVANIASGLFGGYPVTGGFSRTAVNDSAGARTPFASIITAGVVLLTIAFFTPLLTQLPNPALGAIIVVAVAGLFDGAEMRHIAKVKPTDAISLSVAFFATLALGIEIGIGVAVAASLAVVFARMATPHHAVLGRVPGTTTWRNIARFPEVETVRGVRVIRIDASLSFANASFFKKLLLSEARSVDEVPGVARSLVLDASGINDVDATGVEALREADLELAERDIKLHLADPKGPVRDVLWRAGLWIELRERAHATTEDAVKAIVAQHSGPYGAKLHRATGTDERSDSPPAGPPLTDSQSLPSPPVHS